MTVAQRVTEGMAQWVSRELSLQQVERGWELRICIFNEFPADGPRPHGESLCRGGSALPAETAWIVTLQLTGLMALGEGRLLTTCFLSGQ